MKAEELPYRTLAPWLEERFGKPVYRVALDAGSTCPNRDGTKGLGGCTYCDVEGSGTGALKEGADLAAQLEAGIRRVERRGPDVGVIAYLQSYTNTYVDERRLDEVLSVLEPFVGRPVVALSVATRPDCLGPATLDTLARWNEQLPTWLELGLESANDQVLLDINRLHTVAEFEEAVARAHERGLLTVGHAILGLPGDGREGARRTAACFARAGVAGVKVHQLMVLKKTQMAAQWRRGELDVLDAGTYLEWLADFVERLAPEQVLHRITGDSPAEKRLAPFWDVHKSELRNRLAEVLFERGTRQGSHAGRAD